MFLKSESEMQRVFGKNSEAIDNTQKIADMCGFEMDFSHLYLPRFTPPDGSDPKTYLRNMTYDGISARLENGTLVYGGGFTEKDYLEGLVPEDALSWSYWMVDEHKAGTSGARLVFHQPERVGTVPLGAMLPKGVGNMLVAASLNVVKRHFAHCGANPASAAAQLGQVEPPAAAF